MLRCSVPDAVPAMQGAMGRPRKEPAAPPPTVSPALRLPAVPPPLAARPPSGPHAAARTSLPRLRSGPSDVSRCPCFLHPCVATRTPPGQVRLSLATLTIFKLPETFRPWRTLFPLLLSPLFPNELLGLQALNAPSCQVRRLSPPCVPEALSLRVSAWTAFWQNCSCHVFSSLGPTLQEGRDSVHLVTLAGSQAVPDKCAAPE